MRERTTGEKIEKIKASSADIIVEKIDGKPYYSIKYFDLKENQGYIGFGSFNLDYVFGWKDKYFDIVEEDQGSKNAISDDLISRKALIDMVMQDIEEIPTAYSADLVCNELENYLFEKYCIEGDEKIDDIVRNGGKKE